jgi:hypothetical protein
VLAWIGYFFFTYAVISAKYGRYFIPMLPAFLILASMALVQLSKWLAQRAGQEGRAIPIMAVLGVLTVGAEVHAAVRHAPEYRLYISELGGGDDKLDYFFPHCDYFDAGAREAFAWVAAHAEPSAELASETEWLARYYAEKGGRKDISTETLTQRRACKKGQVCYVVVQVGRVYGHNLAAVEELKKREPVFQVQVANRPVEKVYRLEAGATLFP